MSKKLDEPATITIEKEISDSIDLNGKVESLFRKKI